MGGGLVVVRVIVLEDGGQDAQGADAGELEEGGRGCSASGEDG